MAEPKYPSSLLIFIHILAACGSLSSAFDEDRKVYIVYMGALPGGQYFATSHHHSILREVLGRIHSTDYMIYSYRRSFNGFAAKLTDEEQRRLAGMEGVVSVFPSKKNQLHTSRSWDWMGFPTSVKRIPTVESDIIIGLLDTGIWPNSSSFNDEGLGPPPKKWQGDCQFKTNFTCNNKLIGARSYFKEDEPVDTEGHGSHTASTAAGREVKQANFFGLAQGTARGAVPSARIAMYKVCNVGGCNDAEILAAFDDAIADGVDFLSVSLGPDTPVNYTYDPIAIGAFHAMKKGILTLQSAGNSGSAYGTAGSLAPWILTVAASDSDRRIRNKLILGNGKQYLGNAVNTFTLKGTTFPLISGADAAESHCPDSNSARLCHLCLNETLVKGKIVLCETSSSGEVPLNSGAIGMIAMDDSMIMEDYDTPYPLPATILSIDNVTSVLKYLNSTKNPQANILKSESVFDPSAPKVASFSSRGPNILSSDILKPDITAPGVDILAAYSPRGLITRIIEDKRSAKYNILSGTSMACPHVTSAAAYVKTFHPHWSPAAIKSALMTTATQMNSSKDVAAEFSYGSGHIHPLRAVEPGLVYDVAENDYIQMLCDEGLSTKQVRLVSGDESNCPKTRSGSARNLNYPSMALKVKIMKPFNVNFSRTVTNVGSANSTYKATVQSKQGVHVTVIPGDLPFKALDEKQHFVVTVASKGLNISNPISLSLLWSDGIHHVRSPIVVFPDNLL